ncbi:Peptidyl-tRNA hydrolase [Nosema granulosis]|uniref:peptidyl-tRNA hydrolase n=1 Tax=Nosema granulosis TaxID=83296 RepID=A0A9P6GZX3_9MICR|nr:Peptidyl-tRNA hydrolase [Nosema granulosis]
MNDYIFCSVIAALVLYILYTRKKRSTKSKSINPYDRISVCMVINKSLKMSTGKIVAQIGHALFNVVATFNQKQDMYDLWKQNEEDLVLYEASIEEIKSLSSVLHKHSIPYSKIIDAGRTQIPSGSNTVLIVGPGKSIEISNLISHLQPFVK